MKKAISLILGILLFVLASSSPGYAKWRSHGHSHGSRFVFSGGVWVGPGWGGWGPWWWGPPVYPYYPAPPVVIEQQPQVYVQPEPEPEEQSYWYFCPNPQGYYPYVKQCPNGWMKVIPYPVPPDAGR